MKCKLAFILILALFIISNVSAVNLDSLGTFKKGEPVRITQVCDDSTYINLSSVSYPNSSVARSNIEMTFVGNGEFYYDFNSTNENGRYDVRGISDGCTMTFATYFDITSNGKEPADGVVIVVFSILFIAFVAWGLVYFVISLGHTIQFEMDLIDLTAMISTYLGAWVFYYVSFEYLGNEVINNLLEIFLSVGAVTHVFLPFVAFTVSFIMTNLKFKKKARITY